MKMTFRQVFYGIRVSLLALFVGALLHGTLAANSTGIAWQADLKQAAAVAEQTNRLLFIHFYGDNCPPCKEMDSTVFNDVKVIGAMNRNFVAVKIHTAKQKEIASSFNVTAIPTDIVLKPNGQLFHRRQGGISKDRFVEYTTFLSVKAKEEGIGPVPAPAPAVQQPVVTAPAPVVPAPPVVVPPQPAAPVQQPVAPPVKQETAIRDPFTKQIVNAPVLPPVTPAPETKPVPAPVAAAPPVVQKTPAVPATPPVAAVPPAAPSAPVLPPAPALPPAPTNAPVAQNPSPVLPPAHPPVMATMTAPVAAPTTVVPAASTDLAFKEPPAGPPCNADEVPKTMVEVPLGLEGYCPVILSKEERWVPGNPAYYTMFRGHVFRFSNEESMTEFAKSPLNYTPVAMGEDIVQMVNRNKKVYGNRKFGVWYQGRVFLFCNQESLDAFAERPEYYAEIAVKYETAFKGSHGLF